MIYQEDLEKSIAQRKQNKKFFNKLKQKNNEKQLDALFHEAHEAAFEEIDCLQCANCCKTTSPIFRDIDILRLSKRLKMDVSRFVQTYLHLDDERDYVLNFAPCPFLGEGNYCAVYTDRPQACREFPHTNRKKMHQILNLTLKNAEICPAVAHVVDNLKKYS
ncbi:MAG: YkgJ family cysteine cluster protein [Crocinitomicaceae bacterium]|nr:YkgJ family cysteine cluster protein [Crocinitomicaceae bacterium]